MKETKISTVKKETKISTIENENKPVGCLEGDCWNNFSKKKYPNGYYIGEFNNGARNGQGTFVWTNWVNVNENEISFGSNKGQGAWFTEYTINRQTGVLESTTIINEELLKGLVVHKYLCTKYDSKNKF